MSITAALIAGAASYMGGRAANRSSAKEAEKNRDFQADMSNTSYQRAVADMKAAGINPMLATKVGGASTPSGSTASQSDEITPAVNSAINAQAARANVDKIEADAEVSKETAESIRLKNDAFDRYMANLEATTESSLSSARSAEAQAGYTTKLADKVSSDIRLTNVSIDEKRQLISESEERIKNMNLNRAETEVQIKLLRARIASELTANEAAQLGLSFEKKYGERFREVDLAKRRAEGFGAQMDSEAKGRKLDTRNRSPASGGVLDSIREAMKALQGKD